MTVRTTPAERLSGPRFIVAQDHFCVTRPYIVLDTWVSFNRGKGRYTELKQAQARARVLNSRNGGK